MKKNLFLLFALLCSVTFFTACSDDDDDNSWKQIPEVVKGDDATLTVNGEAVTSGSVEFNVESCEKAVVTLKNVVSGYATVPVNVALTKKNDSSFDFSGETDLSTFPVTRTDAQPVVVTVKVTGNVTLAGKVIANVTISGLGLYAGTYEGEKLALNYSGSPLLGKSISITTVDGQTASISLPGVVPGESAVLITDVTIGDNGVLTDGTFTTTGGAKIEYSGNISNKALTLNLTVTLSETAQGNLAGNWTILRKFETVDKKKHAPFFFSWKSPYDEIYAGTLPSDQTAASVQQLLSQLVANVLEQVTFGADGNITANYYSGLELTMDWMMSAMMSGSIKVPADRQWERSPKNLAFWYVKDAKVYVLPDINMIMNLVAQNNGNSSGMDISGILELIQGKSGAEIKALIAPLCAQLGLPIDIDKITDADIEKVMGWLVTGVPLNYAVTDFGLSISLDKEFFDMIVPALLPALPALQAAWEKIVEENSDFANMNMLLTYLTSFEKLANVWNTTTSIEAGLEAKKTE